jgi:hypothetical protein
MKTPLASAILLSTASLLSAQTKPAAAPPPPAYTPVRWNEDYSYLRTSAAPADLFDPIKYIPLNDAGDFYLSLGAQARYRYEWFENANFGAGPQDNDGFHLLRVMGHADLHLGKNVRTFVQMTTAQATGREGGERPVIDENDLDFHQAFLDFIVPFEGDRKLLLRGGRQNLLYGAQRLISPLDWTNTRRTFDGGRASLSFSKNHTLDYFYVHPVVFDEGPIDSYTDDISFTGLYDTLMLPNLIEGAGTRVEAYALYIDRETAPFAAAGTGEENRYTLGGRFYTNPKPWDFDVEAAYQFGDFLDGDISAWMFATEAGYTFTDAPLTPRAYDGFDMASGDADPADGDLETFNQLFPLGHAYFGYIDVIGRQNIVDLHPGVEVTLLAEKRHVKKLSLRGDYHFFWRQSDDDAVYNAAGAVFRADLGSDAGYVGSEIDLLLNWQIDRHLNAYLGYSHFFAGDFLEDTGPSDDIDFLYGAVTYTF